MENDEVLDLSTGPGRRSPPLDDNVVKIEPASPQNSLSESDSGLDTVDSARNSADDQQRVSPTTSLASGQALSPRTDNTEEGSMPPSLVLPQSLPPGLTIPNGDSKDGLQVYPYEAMTSMMMNPALLNSMPGMEGPPFPGSVTQLISHRRRRAGEKRPASSSESESALPGKKSNPVPTDKKDDSYWERRRRNNDAAKRSRDMRRRKEEEIAMRAAYLEQENLKLRAQVAILKNETAKLHYLLYNRV